MLFPLALVLIILVYVGYMPGKILIVVFAMWLTAHLVGNRYKNHGKE